MTESLDSVEAIEILVKQIDYLPTHNELNDENSELNFLRPVDRASSSFLSQFPWPVYLNGFDPRSYSSYFNGVTRQAITGTVASSRTTAVLGHFCYFEHGTSIIPGWHNGNGYINHDTYSTNSHKSSSNEIPSNNNNNQIRAHGSNGVIPNGYAH
jgi:hypothetical protein